MIPAGDQPKRQRVPDDVRYRVYARNGGRCIVCGRRAHLTVHHVLPVSRWPNLQMVEENLVGICWAPCHANHEAAARRIRRAELPACVLSFVWSMGDAAMIEIERHYP